MGKDLKGRELGRGLSQRADGRYMGRAQVNGKSIILYNWKIRTLKKELEHEILEARKNSLMIDMAKTSITLNEWFEEWYASYKAPTLKHGGSPAYKRKFTNYYGVRIGTKPLPEIRQIHVQTAIADMLEAGRSSKSVREATGILQGCLDAAIANGMMRINPVLGTIIPKCEKVERRVLSVEEQEIFIQYLERNKSWYEELYKFMLTTGMRIGEIGGLRWEDIDFKTNFIYVRRNLAYDYANGKRTLMMTSPKTENSVRRIPFFEETISILKSQMVKIEAKRKELADRWRQPEELGNLVFLTSRGTPIGRYVVESDLKKVTDQINEILRMEALYGNGSAYTPIERIHPHALRHTFATRCFEKGMTPRTVQEIMGHANYNTTVSYTHVMDDIKTKEAQKVGQFLKNVQNDSTFNYDSLIGIM